MDHTNWIGKRVKQTSCAGVEFEHRVGCRGTVIDSFTDEKGNVHCQTREDGVWCPAVYLTIEE
jgi:hypothetical protein